jgi:hypothetical protein
LHRFSQRLIAWWLRAANRALAAPEPSAGRKPFVAEFKRIDTAGKGRITMDEALEYYRSRFRQLDRNGDRFLEASELEAAMPMMDATSAKELVQKLDRNSDGKLSEEEFMVIANWLFQLAKSPKQLMLSDVEKG